MRLLIVLMLLATALPVVPTVAAHACSGTSNCACPVPNDGQMHSHAGPTGSCTNGASATPGGAQAPGPALPLVLVGIGLLAAVVSRRR